MRTADEIVQWSKDNDGPLNFGSEVLVDYLPAERVPDLGYKLQEDTGFAWKQKSQDPKDVTAEMKAYMDTYGWPKAEDHRGISASRTIDKMAAWLWLLGKDDLLAAMEAAPYKNYGAPKLKVIALGMGWEVPTSPVLAAMMEGEVCPACQAGHESGCGS